MDKEFKDIKLEKRENTAIMAINRPENRNSLNANVRKELSEILNQLQNDEKVRVLVITGTGEKAFIAGADIPELKGRTGIEHFYTSEEPKIGKIYEEVENFPKPVIAMINGYALGGGCEVAMACDIRLAAKSSSLGLPEIKLGIMPGGGGTQRLPRLVGEGKAMQLILTGDIIDAEEAKQIGLVDEVFPDGKLEDKTLEIANKMASKSPIALRMAKRAIQMSRRAGFEAGRSYEIGLVSLLFSTEDKEEGIRAFLEKEEPKFKGK